MVANVICFWNRLVEALKSTLSSWRSGNVIKQVKVILIILDNIYKYLSILANICQYLLFQNWKWWNSGWIIIYLFHSLRKQLLNRKRLGKVLTSEYSLLVSFRLFLHIHNIMLNIYIFVCLNIQYNLRIHTADKFFFVTYIKYLTSNFCISLGNCILICQYM